MENRTWARSGATAFPAQASLPKPSRTRHPYTLQPSNPPPIPLPAPSCRRVIRPSSAHPESRRGPPHRQAPSLLSQTTAHRLDPSSIPSILPLPPNQQRPPLKRRFPHLAPPASRPARPRPRPASTHRTAPRHAWRPARFAKPDRTRQLIRRYAVTQRSGAPAHPRPAHRILQSPCRRNPAGAHRLRQLIRCKPRTRSSAACVPSRTPLAGARLAPCLQR